MLLNLKQPDDVHRVGLSTEATFPEITVNYIDIEFEASILYLPLKAYESVQSINKIKLFFQFV